MEGNTSTNNIEKSVNKSLGNAGTKSEAEIKRKLQKQIRELRVLISRLECRMSTSTFRDVKIVTNSDNSVVPHKDSILNVDARLKNELYRFAGFYCVKQTEDEYIFNFSPSHKYEKDNNFTVQILIVNGNGTLGKWVMPMSVDLDELKSKYKIKNLDNILPFLRACKNYIDCYYSRLEQFKELTNNITGLENCSLQSNLGYTQFILKFREVHVVEDNVYMDIIIYLMYNIGETRPCKVKFESRNADELSEASLKSLKSCLRTFKRHDLNSAFEEMFTGSDMFAWSGDRGNENPIVLNNLRNSEEEGFLDNLAAHSQSTMMTRERKRKIHNRKKQIQKNVKDLLKSPNTSAKSIRSGTVSSRSETLNRRSLNKEMEVITDASNTVMVTSTQPKQKKLRFEAEQNQVSNKTSDIISSKDLSKRPRIKNSAVKLFTSTPRHSIAQNTFNLIASTSCDISDIATNEDIPRRITRHKNAVQPDEEGQRDAKDKKQIGRPKKFKVPKNNANIKSFMRNVPKKK